jgi:hypothetical protein
MALRSVVLFVLALTVAGSVLYLWRRPRPRMEATESEGGVVVTPPPPAVPEASPVIAAPLLADVQPTLDRVFERTLVVDASAQPPFVAGDFNGDGAADLAVAVRPRGDDALSTLNAELPPWRTQDAAAPPDASGRPAPATIASGQRLLAVVHGSQEAGWRDPSLSQGYLVTNAAATRLEARPLSAMPDHVRMNATRVHAGDVVVATRDGRPSVVFWTGAVYRRADLDGRSAPSARR